MKPFSKFSQKILLHSNKAAQINLDKAQAAQIKTANLNHICQLTLSEPVFDMFVLRFRPKKQQFSVALPTP